MKVAEGEQQLGEPHHIVQCEECAQMTQKGKSRVRYLMQIKKNDPNPIKSGKNRHIGWVCVCVGGGRGGSAGWPASFHCRRSY